MAAPRASHFAACALFADFFGRCAVKAVRLRLTNRKLFEKSLIKNFYICSFLLFHSLITGGMDMFQILVVEDDRELNKTVCSYLDQNGYHATGCLDVNAAYDAMYGGSLFDLILSDIMMPGIDGFEFAKTVRELNQEIPLLFMTARDDFASKQKGFRAGIDDYMVKPIDLDELLLRIQALLRRAKIATSKRLEVGGLVLDADELSATVDGEDIPLTVREFNLIYKLLSYPKKTFTRSQLMEEFWDGDTSSGPRTVDVYITKLRSKFSACKDFEIVTVHGLGYKAVLK